MLFLQCLKTLPESKAGLRDGFSALIAGEPAEVTLVSEDHRGAISENMGSGVKLGLRKGSAGASSGKSVTGAAVSVR